MACGRHLLDLAFGNRGKTSALAFEAPALESVALVLESLCNGASRIQGSLDVDDLASVRPSGRGHATR